MASRRSNKRRLLWIVPLVLIGGLGAIAWYHLFRTVPTSYASEAAHFKYGSVGVEAANGMPYWVWYVLPRVCAEQLAGRDGYTSFGFIWEEGEPAPIGLPVMTIGFPRLGINCALCHTGTVRTHAASEPQLLLGAPSTTIDLQAYLRFLFACASSPQFTASHILREIALVFNVSWIERLLYRFLIIPQTQKALLQQKAQLAWMGHNPDWGPGRQDPFNPAKTQILQLPFDGSIGNADIMPLWNWTMRNGSALHWDGLNTSLREVFLNSGIGNGATPHTIRIDSLERMQRWIHQLPAAPYPYPVNHAVALQGAKIFQRLCVTCHMAGEERVGQPIPLAQLGTDPHRLGSWSRATADAFNRLDVYDWTYTGFRDTYGYVAEPLDGIWARAPYLHNGAVPSLYDLLEQPELRPKVFYRGYNVYDQERVGFVSDTPEAAQSGFRFDTSQAGNGNGGHRWGTHLTPEEKRALIEYMKTL